MRPSGKTCSEPTLALADAHIAFNPKQEEGELRPWRPVDRRKREDVMRVLAFALSFALVTASTAGRPAEATSAQTPPRTDAQGDAPLSEKLSNTNGVIHPQADVDPGIGKAPPPTGGTMPVVPPAGSPGGNPDVQPK